MKPQDTHPSSPALTTLGWGILHALPIFVLAAAWEIYARSGSVTMFVLPPLSVVL